MAKVDIKLTLHFKGDSPDYRDYSIEDMDETLDDILSDLLPDDKIKYHAKLENRVTGVIVEKRPE